MYQGDVFPTQLGGPAYLMARPAAVILYETALDTPFFHIEARGRLKFTFWKWAISYFVPHMLEGYGNEAWGQLGQFGPLRFSPLFRRQKTVLHQYWGLGLVIIF